MFETVTTNSLDLDGYNDGFGSVAAVQNHTYVEKECPIKSRPNDVIQCLPCEYIHKTYPLEHEPSNLFCQGDIIVYDIGMGEAIGTVLCADAELTDQFGEVRTDGDGLICDCDILRFATWDDIKILGSDHRKQEKHPLHIEWGLPIYPMPPV